MNSLLLLVALHFIGDFAFQSAWMAMEKGKDWQVLTYHVCTYTAPFALLLEVPGSEATVAGVVFIFITHFVEDAAKGRYGLIKSIWLDQAIHLAVLIFVRLVGWM